MGYGKYSAVGRGLNKIFVGGILSIFSFIPLLGSILALVGLILTLIGLNEASQVEYDYKTAFMLSIAAIVLNVLGLFLPFMSLIASILNFAVVYCICNTTAAILDARVIIPPAMASFVAGSLYLIFLYRGSNFLS